MTRADALRQVAPILAQMVRADRERATDADAVDASPGTGPVVGTDRGDFSGEAA